MNPGPSHWPVVAACGKRGSSCWPYGEHTTVIFALTSSDTGLDRPSPMAIWRPSQKSGEPDRHDYEIKVVNGVEVAPGPNWHSLFRWVVRQAAEFLAFQTVFLITDN